MASSSAPSSLDDHRVINALTGGSPRAADAAAAAAAADDDDEDMPLLERMARRRARRGKGGRGTTDDDTTEQQQLRQREEWERGWRREYDSGAMRDRRRASRAKERKQRDRFAKVRARPSRKNVPIVTGAELERFSLSDSDEVMRDASVVAGGPAIQIPPRQPPPPLPPAPPSPVSLPQQQPPLVRTVEEFAADDDRSSSASGASSAGRLPREPRSDPKPPLLVVDRASSRQRAVPRPEPLDGNRTNRVLLVRPVKPGRRAGKKLRHLPRDDYPDDDDDDDVHGDDEGGIVAENAETAAASHVPDAALELLAHPTVGIASFSDTFHLRHLMRVIDACAPPDANRLGSRVWLGLTTLLNYYFASTLQLFLGDRVVLRIMQIPSSTGEFGASLYTFASNRYMLFLLADFDYWERLLRVAVGLPDIYFERDAEKLSRTYQRLSGKRNAVPAPTIRLVDQTLRRYEFREFEEFDAPSMTAEQEDDPAVVRSGELEFVLRDGNSMPQVPPRGKKDYAPRRRSPATDATTTTTTARAAAADPDVADEVDADSAESLDLAVAALCLVHRFEMLLDRDLCAKVPNYVTLAKMFTRHTGSVNPFRVRLVSN